MNWDDARIFLAIRREGTLRAAARALNLDQATVGRRLATLEHSLAATLFLRTSKGYALTQAGQIAVKHAENMERAAHDLTRQTQGLDKRLAGDVKVTTTDALALEFVIPAIERLNAKHPDVCVHLSTSTKLLNLAKREADIAVRTVRPRNPGLVARQLVSWEMGLFASQAYLDRYGEPEQGQAFAGHELVVYQPYIDAARVPALAGEPLHGGRIVARFDSNLSVRAAIKAGIGIGEIPASMGASDGLIRIWPSCRRETPYEVWLVTHEDLRRTARIRATIDEIGERFRIDR
ncbi:LysR family transcriptional regulator [Paraburkholderia sp. Ac-20340]|uniref:LysR family transcriptional regulator n=1 Tax=Paraburkholderia sp. Ac-20340 TaxID=2703888 RepID=UPI0019820672|nr:LysR family transcriptional regulator [Paraburkholderia sp. Ac-20340]MBN3857555.1 LysR family transcriptional regulator [Paraburkholderia sp. Ac-20340]